MKAILEFDLPEERSEFNAASKGVDYYLVLWDLDQYLRNSLKYGTATKITPEQTLELVRKLLHEKMEIRGVSFDDVD